MRIERVFEDVTAALDALPGPVHLYGHSFGGTCAVEAGLRSGNLRRLMLSEGGPKARRTPLHPGRVHLRVGRAHQGGQGGRGGQHLHAESRRSLFRGAARPPPPSGMVRAGCGPRTIPRKLRALNDYAADMAKIGTIEASTLLIAGSETGARRREMFEGLARVLANGWVALLPGQRHAAHQAAPELLASTLRQFLAA